MNTEKTRLTIAELRLMMLAEQQVIRTKKRHHTKYTKIDHMIAYEEAIQERVDAVRKFRATGRSDQDVENHLEVMEGVMNRLAKKIGVRRDSEAFAVIWRSLSEFYMKHVYPEEFLY